MEKDMKKKNLNEQQELAVREILQGRNVVLSGRSSTGKRSACQQADEALRKKGHQLFYLTDFNSRQLAGKINTHTVVVDSTQFGYATHAIKMLKAISSSTKPFAGFRVVVLHHKDQGPSHAEFGAAFLREDPAAQLIDFHLNMHKDAAALQVLNFLDGKGNDVPLRYAKGECMYGDAGRRQIVITADSWQARKINQSSNVQAMMCGDRIVHTYESLVNSTHLQQEWTPTYIFENPEASSTVDEVRDGLSNTKRFQMMDFVIFPWVAEDGGERLAFRARKITRDFAISEAQGILAKCGWNLVEIVHDEPRRPDCIPMRPRSLNLAVGSVVSYWAKNEEAGEAAAGKTRFGTVIAFEQNKRFSIAGWAPDMLWPKVQFWDDNSQQLIVPTLSTKTTELFYKVTYASLPLNLSYAVPHHHLDKLLLVEGREGEQEGSNNDIDKIKIRTNPQWFLQKPHQFRWLVARTPSWMSLRLVGGYPPWALLRRCLAGNRM